VGSAMGATTEPRTLSASGPTVRELLSELADRLQASAAIGDPECEARALLAALLAVPRSWLSLNRAVHVPDDQRGRALVAADKRLRGAPLAYCVGTAAFRRMTLHVDERVLVPRPETEQLVDVALAALGEKRGGVAVDVGTGSGAIALALATEASFDRVIATDVSLDALAVARRNAELVVGSLRAAVEFRHGSLLNPLGEERVSLIVSNPPYVANDEVPRLPASVRDWEPPIALASGSDGLRATARLVRECPERLLPGGVLALEVDSRRAGSVAHLARSDARLTGVRIMIDLAGRERFVVARRKEEG
jgi:release factor glutamine methyltransferase